ncbi:hypothetical protein BSNK01_09450 [Bacillaceae bacterium]
MIEPGIWSFEKVRWGTRVFQLHEALQVFIDHEEDQWSLECEHLGIRVFGERFETVLEAFYEEFSMLWDEYALEEDNRLTLDAVKLKNRLVKLVKWVEEE